MHIYKSKFLKTITSFTLIAIMAVGLTACNSSSPGNSDNPNNAENSIGGSANKSAINIVWYPNESSNTHTDVRDEVARLVKQATGREAKNVTTTDYTVAIEAIASGSADIAMAMGAVGYIEAKNRNPDVDVMFTNADADGGIEGAKYFSWLCVPVANADDYKNGDEFSIDNIKGKKMSFVSNSSTSGFKVPTSSIISHFSGDSLTEDDLLPDGSFFGEVYFGQSHQGSAINLIAGNVDVAAFCDIELQPYIEIKSGEANTVGAVYAVKADADAPFDAHSEKEFTVIACTPVFNGPNAVNPKNLSAEEIKAITDLFTSEEVTGNEKIFFDGDDPNAYGLYKIGSSKGYVAVDDSWYDPYR
jgi:phosphonate transport system substrate-binding protein